MPMQMIKCRVCGKDQADIRFSPKQLDDYRASKQRARGPRDRIHYPRCRDCSPKNVEELECAECNNVFSKDRFSKAQRKNPDNARCHDCSQGRQDMEPIHRDQEREEENADRYKYSRSQMNGYFSSAMALSAHTSDFGNQSDGYRASMATTGAVYSAHNQVPSRHALLSNNSANTYVSTAAAATNSGSDTFRSLNGTYQNSRASTASFVGSSSGFVKSRAPAENEFVKAHRRYARDQQREAIQANQARYLITNDSDDDEEGPY